MPNQKKYVCIECTKQINDTPWWEGGEPYHVKCHDNISDWEWLSGTRRK